MSIFEEYGAFKATSLSIAYKILTFSEKIMLSILMQTVHIKCQALFSLKEKKNKKKTPRNVFVFSALRVEAFLICCTATADKRISVWKIVFFI